MAITLEITINPGLGGQLDELPTLDLKAKFILEDFVAGWVDDLLKYGRSYKDEALSAIEYWLTCAEEAEYLEKQDRPDKAALVPKDRSTAQGEHRDKSADQADPV